MGSLDGGMNRIGEEPEAVFDLSEGEESTLATNGVARLQFRKGDAVRPGQVIRVLGAKDKNYTVRVKDITESRIPEGTPKIDPKHMSSVPDADIVIELLKTSEKKQ